MLNDIVLDDLLIKKYNQPVPRYTSYPTVPVWQNGIDVLRWEKLFTEQFSVYNATTGISIYVHLPFCESLCTYCGCNKKISTRHSVEEVYLQAIDKEWNLYRKLMGQTPVIREIHLGGGTPTFFSPMNLAKLVKVLLKNSIVHPIHEFSIEGHPNNTTTQHLKVLASLGFRRISYGVQDLDPDVQKIINRIQPLENVKRATEEARQAGFTSVNFDLIYGLPLQTVQSLEKTFREVIGLRPDRIAFYSYAHVPWTSKTQRLFNESLLPGPEEKTALYLTGKKLLQSNGYLDIGMDHFALPHDELAVAREHSRLHRNFMGYTTRNSKVLLGLGVSAISDIGNAFAQNAKTLHGYYASINKGIFAVKRGYFLDKEDIAFGQYIKDIACKGAARFNPEHMHLIKAYTFPILARMASDGLVEYDQTQMTLTEKGHYFIRHACSAFDLHLQRNFPETSKHLFSKAI